MSAPEHGLCRRCLQALVLCDCGVWWCPGRKHAANRADGSGSHFCYLGQQLVAQPKGVLV